MADAPSTPSFPYNGPFKVPGGGGGTQEQATVTLSTDATTLTVGSRFTVDVRVATVDAKVKSYQLVINYDPTKLTLVDDDTSSSGIQVKYLDTLYQASQNTGTVDTATNTGVITLKVAAPNTTSQTAINRRVAQITFQAKATGSADVSVKKSDSKVLNQSDTDILATVNNASLTIGGQATSSVSSTPTSSATSTSTSSLPSTGISDFTAMAGTIVAGIIMVFVGIKTLLKKKAEQFWPE